MGWKLLPGIVACVLLFATPSVSHAQQPPTLRADIVSITAGDYPAARAIVNIDTNGGDVKGLTAANFAASVGGETAPVLSADLASSQNVPLDVLFLMDVSGSMAGEPIKQTRSAAKGFVEALGPNDRVAVISFADTVKLVLDYTSDRAQANAAIDGLSAFRGNTALYDATAAAAFKAGTSPSSRRAVILLSDGAQNGVKIVTTRDQAIAAAAGAGVPFFAIGEGKDIDRAYLGQLGSVSKGRYLEAPKLSDLNGLYASIGQLLQSQFIVSFDASSAAGAPETSVVITLQSGSSRATAQATFKPGPGFGPPPVIVTLTGLKEGEAIDETRTITATPDRTAGLTRVAFYVDDVNVFETAVAPYVFAFDPNAYPADVHRLKAAAIVGTTTFESAPVAFSSHPPVVTKTSGGGGGASLPILPIAAVAGGIVVIVLIGAFAHVVVRRARDGSVQGPPAEQRITPWATRHRTLTAPPEDPAGEAEEAAVEEIGEPMGVLIARAGPFLGSEHVVGGTPVSIGSGARCGVRIDDVALSEEEARIWVRDGHLMLHRMTRLSVIAADGPSGGWTILQPGDTLDIGQHRFEFRLWAPQPPNTEDALSDIPNILRDPDIPRRPATPQSAAAPAGLGQIWPAEDVPQPAPGEAPDLDEQAS